MIENSISLFSVACLSWARESGAFPQDHGEWFQEIPGDSSIAHEWPRSGRREKPSKSSSPCFGILPDGFHWKMQCNPMQWIPEQRVGVTDQGRDRGRSESWSRAFGADCFFCD